MSEKKKQVEDIEKMFGIDSTASSESDSNEGYNSSSDQSKVAFEQSIDEFGDAIKAESGDLPELEAKNPPAKIEPPKPEPKPEPKVESSKPEPAKVEQKSASNLVEEVLIESSNSGLTDSDNIFAEIETKEEENVDIGGKSNESASEISDKDVEMEPAPEKVKSAEESPKETVPFDTPENIGEEGQTETEKSAATSAMDTISIPSQDGWILNCPSPKFSAFYRYKAQTLSEIIQYGGKIDVDKYRRELSEARIETHVDSFDPNVITKKMSEVVSWLERLSPVFCDICSQLYKADIGVTMLRGVLARIEYEKPKERNEGLVFEHLRDFEYYTKDLKGLAEIADLTIKRLNKGWDTLSRQLSVVLGEKEKVERQENIGKAPHDRRISISSSFGTQSHPASGDSATDDADGIEGPVQQSSKELPKGSQVCEWDDIDK